MRSQPPFLNVKQVSLVSVFAAVSVVTIIFLPGIPMIGLPGARITLDASIAPVCGLIIGPYLGALAALIGGLIVAGYRGWPIFSILTSFSPAVSAFVAGMLSIKSVRVAGHNLCGWGFSALTVTALIGAWYLTWIGKQAPFYPLIHWAGLIVILTFRGRISTFFETGDKRRLSLAIFLASYCGLISDHMLGNLTFILGLGSFIPLEAVSSILTSMSLPSVPALFIFMLPISAAERLAMALIATAFGTSAVTLLRKSHLMPNAS